MKKKLLTIKQAARPRTPFSAKAIRMKIWRGEFPYTRVGRRIFVDEDSLDRYLALLEETSAEEAAAKIEEHAA